MTKRWDDWIGWHDVSDASRDEDVTLLVTDGRGDPYILKNLFRLTDHGWVHSSSGAKLKVQALKWRKPPQETSRNKEVAEQAGVHLAEEDST